MKFRHKYLKVGAHKYAIVFDEGLERQGWRADICHRLYEIRMNPNIPGQRIFASVLHESLHAIEAMFDLELEEATVKQLAHGISMVMRDNPWLVKYL